MSKSRSTKAKAAAAEVEALPAHIAKAHQEQNARNVKIKNDVRQGNHLQENMQIDVAKSYQASIARLDKNAPDYKDQVAHIEAVLSSGNFRHSK